MSAAMKSEVVRSMGCPVELDGEVGVDEGAVVGFRKQEDVGVGHVSAKDTLVHPYRGAP